MSDDDQMWVPTRGGLLGWLRGLGGRLAAPRVDPPEPHPAKLTGLRERVQFYGDPGRGAVDKAWQRQNIITCRDKNGDRPTMPGVPAQWYFEIHRLVEPHARRAFAAARDASPEYEIERAASFVFRHQRHDPSRPLSLHSWGIAIDVDAALNAAHTFTPGEYPEPWGPAWVERWPRGLPQGFVEAFEAAGWTWGGRWREFCDPQHFQWDRRP